jgi:hypothetical protein
MARFTLGRLPRVQMGTETPREVAYPLRVYALFLASSLKLWTSEAAAI